MNKDRKIVIIIPIVLFAIFMATFGYHLIENYYTEYQITGLYRNILHRSPEPQGLTYWKDQVISNTKSLGQVENEIRNSPEAIAYSKISDFYHKYLKRDLDSYGQSYWEQQILQNGKSYDWVEGQIRNSPEAKSVNVHTSPTSP